MPVATPADVALHVRRALTTEEQAYATNQIETFTELLEATLKRTLRLDQFAEVYSPIPASVYASAADTGWSTIYSYSGGRVYLRHKPVHQVVKVMTVPKYGSPRDITADVGYESAEVLSVPVFDDVEVTYTAGDEPTPGIIGRMVAMAVARSILVPAVAATGAMSSYSVEGTSVSYQGQQYLDTEAVGPFSGAEMRAVRAQLQRTIIR